MSDNASWGLLLAELLEKIFENVPWLMLGNIGKVCTHWRDVVHRLAVKHLTSGIQNQLIEEKQLERWGWCSATAWDHSILSCPCIHLAFDFLPIREKTFPGQGFSGLSMNYATGRIPVGIMTDKLFFATADEEKQVSLKVINRQEPECQERILKSLAPQQKTDYDNSDCSDDYEDWEKIDAVNVQMVCCENLLVVLVFETGQVSLWDGKNEAWLADLDISSVITHNPFLTYELTVSKDLLAVYVSGSGRRNNRVLFFRLNTGQPAATPPQLIGMVEIKFGEISVHMNEKWVGLWREIGRELVVIKKTELFSEDQSQVAKIAKVADPKQAINLWRNVGHAKDASYLNLQPGSSNHLAVEHKLFDKTKPRHDAFSFTILNLETGEILCKISNTVNLFPASWWGDAFLFLRKLEACDSDESVKLQVVTCDFSQRISDGTVEDLEKEAICLLPGPVFEFSGAPKLYFERWFMTTLKKHLDYSGVVVYEEFCRNLHCAAFE
jgi:hypothetical protein